MDIKKIKGFLLDMDGTVYLSGELLPGALDFINHLLDQGVKFLFFTNNPSSSVSDYVEKLGALGINKIDESNIITSGQATINHLKEKGINSIYLVGTPSFEKEVEKSGIKLTDQSPGAVVLSFDKTLTYEKLVTATHLINQGVYYIATNPDLVCPTSDGPVPDCGAMAALLKESTQKDPLYIGKPQKGMIDAAISRLNIDASELAIVGDRLYTDIKMALNHGAIGTLVLSGETKESDLLNSEIKPDVVVENLGELLELFKK